MLKPLPVEVSEIAYASVCKVWCIDDLSKPARLKPILDVSKEHLLTKISPDFPLMPVIDDEILAKVATYSQVKILSSDYTSFLAGKDWCEELLIGDCPFDVSFTINAENHRSPKFTGIYLLGNDKTCKSWNCRIFL